MSYWGFDYKEPGGNEPIDVWIQHEYEMYQVGSSWRWLKSIEGGTYIHGQVVANDGKVATIEYEDGTKEEYQLKYADKYEENKEWRKTHGNKKEGK